MVMDDPINPDGGVRVLIVGGGERAAFTVVVPPAVTEIPDISCVAYPLAVIRTSYTPGTRPLIEYVPFAAVVAEPFTLFD